MKLKRPSGVGCTQLLGITVELETNMKTESKYIAIKVKGINHWLWFERSKVVRADGKFSGKNGWGDGGAHTEIITDESLIEGEIDSEQLQYE